MRDVRPPQVRRTRQRVAIEEAFARAGRPLDAEEVLELAGRRVAGISLATVYRNIKRLLGEGRLVSVETVSGHPCYELAGKKHHHHFLCTSCRRVFDVEGCGLDWRRLTPSGFRTTSHEILLQGRCRDCA